MDSDIEFGHLEESAPRVQRRPDEDPRYQVVAVGQLQADDLPIFVDLDVAREMENHSQSDSEVELGGVLLGGQYVDSQGRPFVLVQESLRARFFEATRGSFKFTHATWEDLTRRRDQFPPELQIVGWYHTHPGWGIFLSDPDQFICRNFFQRTLDVAFVIDPCQGERGWFQWRPNDPERMSRTGGYYLFTSRLREEDLSSAVAEWSNPTMMSAGSGQRVATGIRPSTIATAGAAPVVHWVDRSASWQGIAIIALCLGQLLSTALITWRLAPPAVESKSVTAPTTNSTDAANAPPSAEAAMERQRAVAQAALMDRVLTELRGAPDGSFSRYADAEEQLRELKTSLRAQTALIEKLENQNQALQAAQTKLTADRTAEQERWQRQFETLQTRLDSQTQELARLRHADAEPAADSASDGAEQATDDHEQSKPAPRTWMERLRASSNWLIGAFAGLLALGCAGVLFLVRRSNPASTTTPVIK